MNHPPIHRPTSRPDYRRVRWGLLCSALVVLLIGAAASAAPSDQDEQPAPDADAHEPRAVEQNGTRAELELIPPRGDPGDPVLAQEHLKVRLKLTDAESGQPLSQKVPAAWVDQRRSQGATPRQQCKERIEQYMPQKLKTRPVIDLNSYVVLGLSRGNVITVLDPFFGFGSSQMITTVALPGQGVDWVLGPDERFVFVSIPKRNLVAVVSTDTWEVTRKISVGTSPGKLLPQPGAKRLWVATSGGDTAGASVVDMVTQQHVGDVAVGAGKHDIAFQSDGRRAFVASVDEGTVAVVDADELDIVRKLRVGATASRVAWSSASDELYVLDGAGGKIEAYDGDSLELVARMTGTPGLSNIIFDPSGRWGFVLNEQTDEVHVLDASVDRIRYGLMSEGNPDQVAFTENFAYVRSQSSPQVMMVSLKSLDPDTEAGAFARDFSGEGSKVDTEADIAAVHFPTGDAAPGANGPLAPGKAMDQAPHKHDAIYIANPSDNSIYFYHYMEGMPTPSGNLKTAGFEPVATMTVGRRLDEVAPGVYEAVVTAPPPGRYEVNFVLEEPRVVDCMPFKIAENPNINEADRQISLDLQAVSNEPLVAGKTGTVRFRLTERRSDEVRGDFEQLRARVVSPLGWQTEVSARPVDDSDDYAFDLTVPEAGVYYLTVSVPKLGKTYRDQHPVTLRAVPVSQAERADAGS